ncbi:MAG: hypothetical protein ABJE10_03965 [bacterium]
MLRRIRLMIRVVLLTCGIASPSLVRGQAMDTATALTALREARNACTQDAGRLWAHSMCGPIALVDRKTRLALANDTVRSRPFLPYADAFITGAPPGVGFANMSFTWGDRPWAMIMLPLPRDRFERIALVMHEVFHREQAALGLLGTDPPNNQLDQRDGRRWFRLELRALAAALDALVSDEQRARSHTEDALLFRARRRMLYPLADSLEPALEMQEGLPAYTGDRLAMTLTGETSARVARRVREFQSNPAYVRSFAYATGPALGLLLDRFAAGWRAELRATPDPARILARHMHLDIPKDLARDAERRAQRYDVAALDREEDARDSLRRGAMAAYKARLVAGPVLTLMQSDLDRNFDPLTLIGFDMMNTVYPTGSFSAEWGSLDVTAGGALVSNDMARVQVGAPSRAPTADDRVVRGDGWVLTLKPGWSLVPAPARAGSYVVRNVTSKE